MNDHVLVRHDGHTATITLNRPEKLNALTLDMLDKLDAIIVDVGRLSDVWTVVVTGGGEKSFCVGADILAWSQMEPLDMWRGWVIRGHQVFDRLSELRQPVIAALNGYTFGGGLELALAADIRIAADSATFSAPEVKLGTIPGWGGTHRLPEIIGIGRAKQMMFSGERIDAIQANNWALVNEIVPADELMSRVYQLCEVINSNASVAVQMTKQLINGGTGKNVASTLEALASALASSTDDLQEGVTAFREKRTAQFNGR